MADQLQLGFDLSEPMPPVKLIVHKEGPLLTKLPPFIHKSAPIEHKPDSLPSTRLDANLYAFVAIARRAGLLDPALEAVRVDSAGRKYFNEAEVCRLANEILRGVRSDRPALTRERWGEAIQAAKQRSAA